MVGIGHVLAISGLREFREQVITFRGAGLKRCPHLCSAFVHQLGYLFKLQDLTNGPCHVADK